MATGEKQPRRRNVAWNLAVQSAALVRHSDAFPAQRRPTEGARIISSLPRIPTGVWQRVLGADGREAGTGRRICFCRFPFARPSERLPSVSGACEWVGMDAHSGLRSHSEDSGPRNSALQKPREDGRPARPHAPGANPCSRGVGPCTLLTALFPLQAALRATSPGLMPEGGWLTMSCEFLLSRLTAV